MSEKLPVIAVMPHGRLMFAETVMSIFQAVQVLNEPLSNLGSQLSGPYWAQTQQRIFEGVLKDYGHLKYILCYDGDSVFDKKDVMDLYGIIDKCTVNGKPIDAVFPVQADRGGEKPLAYNWSAPQLKYDHHSPWMPYIHGHFGLTFIRLEAIAAMPKPWLLDVPNSNGTWDIGNGKMDCDTYFWAKFYDTGRVAVLANQTVIGHIQSGIRWQVGSKVVWQRYSDYLRNGKPYGVRAPMPEEYPEPHPTNVSAPSTGESLDAADARNFDSTRKWVGDTRPPVAKPGDNGKYAPPVEEELEVNP